MQEQVSKASLFRASTRGNDPARATEFSPTRGASLNRGGSRINDFSPGSKSKTNLDATGVSMGSGLGVLQKQATGGVNNKFKQSKTSIMSRTNNANVEAMSFSPDSRRKSRFSNLDQESVQFATNNQM